MSNAYWSQTLKQIEATVFDEPMSAEAKYWVGFLMADGNISAKPGQPESLIRLKRDIDHIRKFALFLKSENKIQIVEGRCGNGTMSPQASFAVSNIQLAKKLVSFGVVPRKSLIAKVSDRLALDADFWRGVVDGDGCLGMYGSPALHLCGSKFLVEQFADFISGLCGVKSPVRKRTTENYSYCIYGIKAKTATSLLYYSGAFGLSRKVAIAQDILRWEPTRLALARYKGKLCR